MNTVDISKKPRNEKKILKKLFFKKFKNIRKEKTNIKIKSILIEEINSSFE